MATSGTTAFTLDLADIMEEAYDLCGSELVGLVPLSAMLESGRWYAVDGVEDERELVAAAIIGLGLSYLDEFDADKRIIEWAVNGE